MRLTVKGECEDCSNAFSYPDAQEDFRSCDTITCSGEFEFLNELGKCEDCGFDEFVDFSTGRGCTTKKCKDVHGNNYFKLNNDGSCTECTEPYEVASFGGRSCI